MDRCFIFQWGDLFSDGGASFLGVCVWGGGGCPMGGISLMGEGSSKKS